MTITVTYKDHAHTREYWVNDGQLKRPIFLPFDSTEEEAIRLLMKFQQQLLNMRRVKRNKKLKMSSDDWKKSK